MLEASLYAGLFLVALAAGSILPLQSEAALVAALASGEASTVPAVAAASAGNVAGATLNYALGRAIERFKDRRWFPLGAGALERGCAWYRRFGRWTLLLSWVPVVGDPLTVAAGVFRESLPTFLLLVAIAKTGRYVFVAAAASAWI